MDESVFHRAMSNRIHQLDGSFAPASLAGELAWHDVQAMGIEGRGFADTATAYERLPVSARARVRPEVWALSVCSAGLLARFECNATIMYARWELRDDLPAMPHMAATGVGGLDLYVKVNDRWRWQAVAKPYHPRQNECPLIPAGAPLKPGSRQYMLYLPLFSGVQRLEIGVPRDATIERSRGTADRNTRPLCFYGSSIVQGGCVSRPGMAYPSVVGRALGRTSINLGFSGQARAEPELAELVAQVDAAVYVLDPLPNLVPENVEERMTTFTRALRSARPRAPIVLMESIRYQEAELSRDRFERCTGSNRGLLKVYRSLQAAGMRDLHYLPGGRLLGDDGEATVDGTHPTDLGVYRAAQVMTPFLETLL